MSTFDARVMRSRRIIAVLAWACAAASMGHAQGRIECSSVPSKILNTAVRYCALLPPSYDASAPAQKTLSPKVRRFAVLYYLHGLGDSERSLADTGGWNLIQDLIEQHQIGEFLIVTPDGGQGFYINSRDGRNRYSDFFLQEFMPAIEHRYRIRSERSARGIMGISMGGYGALRFAFARPELFASVSAQSAALMPESPRDLNVAMSSGTQLAGVLGGVFGNPINLVFWRQNSPLVLARRNTALIRKLKLNVYFDCGAEDEYGFDRGARALDDQLRADKIPHEFHLYPGGHNLIYFLQHLGASIEFHSKAFDAAR